MNQNNSDGGADLDDAVGHSNSRMKFEDEQQNARFHSPDTPKIVQWVIKYSGGYVKDEKQANYVLIGFVILAGIVSLFFIFGGNEGKLTPAEQQFQDIPSELI